MTKVHETFVDYSWTTRRATRRNADFLDQFSLWTLPFHGGNRGSNPRGDATSQNPILLLRSRQKPGNTGLFSFLALSINPHTFPRWRSAIPQENSKSFVDFSCTFLGRNTSQRPSDPPSKLILQILSSQVRAPNGRPFDAVPWIQGRLQGDSKDASFNVERKDAFNVS
jgi:hypothetical protein